MEVPGKFELDLWPRILVLGEQGGPGIHSAAEGDKGKAFRRGRRSEDKAQNGKARRKIPFQTPVFRYRQTKAAPPITDTPRLRPPKMGRLPPARIQRLPGPARVALVAAQYPERPTAQGSDDE